MCAQSSNARFQTFGLVRMRVSAQRSVAMYPKTQVLCSLSGLLYMVTLCTTPSIENFQLMHRALFVSDILLYIFTHVDRIPPIAVNNSSSPSRKSLASLAATCKAFYEPAMDLLWADVFGLERLLGCVTRLHPLVYRASRDWDPWAGGVEPLSADEARQCLRHSARIRSLTILRTDNRLVPLLSVIPVDVCVFPRLQRLSLPSPKYLGLFLSHTLRHCFVSSGNVNHAIPADQLSLLSDRVRLCNQLVTLSCPPLDWAAWKHLSNLPTLAEIEVHGIPPWLLEQHILNFSPFLHLTSLSFWVYSAAYATTILQHLQFPSLKSFLIDVDVLTLTEAERFFRALSNCKQTLEQLTIIFERYHDPQYKALTAIQHLLSFTQLRSLRLGNYDSGACICLDNNLLLEAMSAWPHIHTLTIEDSSGLPFVTFRGLFTAIRQRPQLESLRLYIDTLNIDIDPDAEPIQHSLQTLHMETPGAYLVNAEVLARIIFKWLPCVDQVNKVVCGWGAWNEVNKHLVSLRTAALHASGAASKP
ncbi:hypothetical protein F4604DRAFT_184360 [Suillus subluteus]|nr:hypothetical protein F4604DRAFT_184360 [Suillus subluteus]